jgi:N-acetylmuramoyl-L-alanine amidase
MTEGALRQSLALWRRRLRKRQSLMQAAADALEQARLQNLHPRQPFVDALAARKAKVDEAQRMIERREGQLATLKPDSDGFMDGVEKVVLEDAGPHVAGKPKLCWHSTEGSSIEGAIGAYRQNRSSPHFTIDPSRDRIVQHISIFKAGRALQHPGGIPETNRARTIQVEIVGFANSMQRRSPAELRSLSRLARWIERNAGVPSRTTVDFVSFPAGVPRRLQGNEWLNYSGHHGHMHVPGNSHEDPGALPIREILET